MPKEGIYEPDMWQTEKLRIHKKTRESYCLGVKENGDREERTTLRFNIMDKGH